LSTAILGFENTLCFQFQIEDLPLEYRMLWEDFKNKITGKSKRNIPLPGFQNEPKGIIIEYTCKSSVLNNLQS